MDPSGTLCLLLVSTEEILYGGAFIGNTCSEDCFCLFKSVKEPLFSPGCTIALKQHGKEAVVAGLRANEGYLELEKLYASIPFPLHVIFHLWRVNDPEVLVYTWYVEVIVCGNLLSLTLQNVLKMHYKMPLIT